MIRINSKILAVAPAYNNTDLKADMKLLPVT